MIDYKLKYNIQYFAKDGPGGEKTEEPTSKKIEDSRKEGQVAKSQELSSALMLLGLFLGIKIFLGFIGEELLLSFSQTYNIIPQLVSEGITIPITTAFIRSLLLKIGLISAPLFIIAFLLGFIANAVQFKWKITTKPLQPKFSKFNPIKGFKKIISAEKIFELLKSLMKIGVIGYVAYDTLIDQYKELLILYDISLTTAISLVGNLIIDLGLKISILFFIIGCADFIYQKRKHKKEIMMTKQEIKDEYKQQEGDPQIKGKIKAKMREVSQRRMMQELPKADVVITNPTHFAVALKYDADSFSAPIVIAKGADLIAEKIKKTAKENNIIIVENKPLARMLYYNVDIGTEIPPELYQMVAEILGYVYGLKEQY